MNFPNFFFWSHLLKTVGVEVCCVVALGSVAQLAFRRALWQRAIWQTTVICMLLVSASEWSGFGRGMVWFLVGPQREAHSAPPSAFIKANPELLVQLGPPASYGASAALKPAVWWPGWIWLAGTVVVLGRMAAAQCLLLALRLWREKFADGPLQERVRRIAQTVGLRRRICLLRLPQSISPMAFGFLWPTVGLPPGFGERFSATEQEAILAHELAHLAVMDPLWFWVADFASAVLWWHPLVWWVRRSLHVSSELAADEATALVPDGPGSLAKCLVALGKEMTAGREWGWVGINGGFRSKLGKRVERLTQMSGSTNRSLAGWADALARIAMTILIVPAVVLLVGAFQTAQGESENGWRQSWNNSPGALLMVAALDSPPTKKERIADRIQSAKLLYEMGKLDEAEAIFVGVLKDDPSNRTVPYFLKLIEEARFMDRARSRNGPITPIPLATNNMDITARVQRGKLLYEQGKLDESEAIFVGVLKDDPSNKTAPYYLDMIKEERFMDRARAREQIVKAAPFYGGPIPNPMANTNRIYTSKGRQDILSKLDGIRFSEVQYDLPLTEVLKKLTALSQKMDPESKGINFFISIRQIDDPGSVPAGAVRVDQPPAMDMSTVQIRISPPLQNVRLADVLNAIVMTADQPIKYTVEDNGVLFSPKSTEAPTLYSRVFRVDPNTFVDGVKNFYGTNFNPGNSTAGGSVTRTNQTFQLDVMVRGFFTAIGVNLTDPGKSVFFNDRTGLLLVRATAKDLEIIQEVVEALNPTTPQVMISAKFVDLSPDDSVSLGFNSFMQDGGTNATAIFSDPQSRVAINAIEHKTGKEIPSLPKVTTQSGRQAHVSSSDGLRNSALDVIPTVSADGYSIQMALIPTYAEFLRYDSSGTFTPQGQSGAGSAGGAPVQVRLLPLPHFRLRQVVATCNLFDGQTVVMGVLTTNRPSEEKSLRLIFITPRIIDPAGNPVHDDEEISKRR